MPPTSDYIIDHLCDALGIAPCTFGELYAHIKALRARESQDIVELQAEVRNLRYQLNVARNGCKCCSGCEVH